MLRLDPVFSLVLGFVLLLATCEERPVAEPEPEQDATEAASAPALAEQHPEWDPERAAALDEALATLEELVLVLEPVRTPFDAYDAAPMAARLVRELETTRPAFALPMSEEEARAIYPSQMQRLEELNRRRDAAINRIRGEAPVANVFFRMMAEADTVATP